MSKKQSFFSFYLYITENGIADVMKAVWVVERQCKYADSCSWLMPKIPQSYSGIELAINFCAEQIKADTDIL